MTPYARFACMQEQSALYCRASASPFEVCPCPGATTYACYACAQEQFVPYCCSSTSPFEMCPETAVHNRTTVVVVCIPNFAAYIYHCWWVRLDCCFCFVRHSENLKHSPRKMREVCERQPLFTLCNDTHKLPLRAKL